MGHTIQWKYRKEFIKQGQRMLLANWLNRCSNEGLDQWYKRNVYKYAAAVWGENVKDNREALARRYWNDVSRALYEELDIPNE